MKNIIIHRRFADFVLDDPIAHEFKAWLEDTCCPEEAFYSTLGRLAIDESGGRRQVRISLIKISAKLHRKPMPGTFCTRTNCRF
jgi:hypothetical protein